MNNKILIITVFISNIAFGNMLPAKRLETNLISNYKNSFSRKVISHLNNQGMQMEAIRKKVNFSFNGSEDSSYMMAQKIMSTIPEIKEQDIVDYFANATLHGKKIDLLSYDNLVSLLQRTDYRLMNKENLKKMQEIIV